MDEKKRDADVCPYCQHEHGNEPLYLDDHQQYAPDDQNVRLELERWHGRWTLEVEVDMPFAFGGCSLPVRFCPACGRKLDDE